MQVLEGPELAVRELFKLIQGDSRHKGIDPLRFEKKESRHFPDWRMGFRNFTVEIESLPSLSCFLEPEFDFSVFHDDSSEAYRALLAFRSAHDV